MASVKRKLEEQEEERGRMVSAGRDLEQRLAAQTQRATHFESRLILERWIDAGAMRTRAEEQERRESELTDRGNGAFERQS